MWLDIEKKVYNAVSMGLRRAFLLDPNLVARKTFTHLNSRGRYLVCFKPHNYTNNNEYLQVVYPNLPLVQTKQEQHCSSVPYTVHTRHESLKGLGSFVS